MGSLQEFPADSMDGLAEPTETQGVQRWTGIFGSLCIEVCQTRHLGGGLKRSNIDLVNTVSPTGILAFAGHEKDSYGLHCSNPTGLIHHRSK